MTRRDLRCIIGIFLTVLFCAVEVFPEAQTGLSGKWVFNPSISKAASGTSFSGSEITLEILHYQKSIKINKTIKNPGGMIDTTSATYILDNKEYVTTEGTIVTKRIGSWSADKKGIILVQTISLGSRVFTTEDLYSVSENGKTLTIQSKETMNSKVGTNMLIYEKR